METTSLDPSYCYTVKELGYLWSMSDESIRRLFEEESGVLIFKIQSTGRRTCRNIRAETLDSPDLLNHAGAVV